MNLHKGEGGAPSRRRGPGPVALQAVALEPSPYADPPSTPRRDDLAGLFDIEARIRNLEIGAASSAAMFTGLKDEVRTMKTDLLTTIEKNTPRSPWPAVSALAAALAVVLVLAAALYQH